MHRCCGSGPLPAETIPPLFRPACLAKYPWTGVNVLLESPKPASSRRGGLRVPEPWLPGDFGRSGAVDAGLPTTAQAPKLA